MIPFPKSIDEIPLDYPVHETGDYRGVAARAIGALAWVGYNLRTPSLAIAWVALCAAGGVWMIADPRINPWFVFVFVFALFLYPLVTDLKLDRFAEKWRDYLHKHIAGRVYKARLVEFSIRAREHEGVHVWQRRRFWWHALAITFDPRGIVPGIPGIPYRAHAEAQAYAYEVARGHRTLSKVTDKLNQWFYFTGLDRDQTRTLILEYKLGWDGVIAA